MTNFLNFLSSKKKAATVLVKEMEKVKHIITLGWHQVRIICLLCPQENCTMCVIVLTKIYVYQAIVQLIRAKGSKVHVCMLYSKRAKRRCFSIPSMLIRSNLPCRYIAYTHMQIHLYTPNGTKRSISCTERIIKFIRR